MMRSDANAFLGQLPDAATKPVDDRAILSEIERVLGSDHRRATEGRLERIMGLMRLTFDALQKNEHGRLGSSAVRYAMHRFFVQRHAWFVRGLEPGGAAWNSSSPTAILGEQSGLPDHVQSLFEQRIGGRGFDLHELAVMAATLENLVHKEAMGRLDYTYRLLERSREDPVTTAESHEVLDSYMASYVLGFKLNETNLQDAREESQQIQELYPTWPETQQFVRDVQASVAPKRDELAYENIAGVVDEIGDRYGHWQDMECRALKKELLAMGDRGTGRVRVADFYGAALHDGKWQFSESLAYLRQLGALDESDPRNLRVIIPNYINSPSNCVAASNYYSVCCLDECEDILGHLEERLGTYEATPVDIAMIVLTLPSTTVADDGTLPAWLLRRLDEVAQHHGGHVPLHGRLLAQWMHLAYPRECSFPHVTGTTGPQRAEDWIASGQKVPASREEMRQHIESSPRRSRARADEAGSGEEGGECGLWSMEEELVSVHSLAPPRAAAAGGPPGSVARALRGVALVASVLTLTLALS